MRRLWDYTDMTTFDPKKSKFWIESDKVGMEIMKICNNGGFYSTAPILLEKLQNIDPDFKSWTIDDLVKRLDELWPHLEFIVYARRELTWLDEVVYDFPDIAELESAKLEMAPIKTIANNANRNQQVWQYACRMSDDLRRKYPHFTETAW